MAAINQCNEADRLRSTVINERIKSGANRATRIEDVINQDHRLPGDVARDARPLMDGSNGDGGKIVAVEADIERAVLHVHALVLLDRLNDYLGKRNAAALNANNNKSCGALFLNDLM